MEAYNRRQAENILKMKTFNMLMCKAYPQEKLNTPKGVVRSRELALAAVEEITAALGKQRVAEVKRIIIRKVEKKIQTNTYIPDY